MVGRVPPGSPRSVGWELLLEGARRGQGLELQELGCLAKPQHSPRGHRPHVGQHGLSTLSRGRQRPSAELRWASAAKQSPLVLPEPPSTSNKLGQHWWPWQPRGCRAGHRGHITSVTAVSG